jgi:hypothetical protein
MQACFGFPALGRCAGTSARRRISGLLDTSAAITSFGPRLGRYNESWTPASNALPPNVSSTHPHQPGGRVKSQPYCKRQEVESIAVQVMVSWVTMPSGSVICIWIRYFSGFTISTLIVTSRFLPVPTLLQRASARARLSPPARCAPYVHPTIHHSVLAPRAVSRRFPLGPRQLPRDLGSSPYVSSHPQR